MQMLAEDLCMTRASLERVTEDDFLKPIFVIGNPRSGTTMLRLVLTCHSEITIPPETDLIVRLFPRYGHVRRFDRTRLQRFLADLEGSMLDLAEQWEVSLNNLIGDREKLLDLSYAELCASLYLSYAQAKGLAPTRCWGDKNNSHCNYIDVLASLYPKARFVHIVRDGRAVLASYKALNVDPAQKYAPLLPKEPAAVARYWADMVDRTDRHLARFACGRSIRIRYEDVLADFEGSISEVCQFLGYDYEPSMYLFNQRNVSHNLEPKHFSWKTNTRKPLDRSRADSWQKDLLPENIAEFEAVAGDVLMRHGYALATSLGSRGLPWWFQAKARTREVLRGLRKQYVVSRSRL